MFPVPPQYINLNGSTNYVTHYGEIYPGRIVHCPNYEEGIFIVADHNLQEISNLKEAEKTPDKYREIGWEIKDFNIVSDVVYNLFKRPQPYSNNGSLEIPSGKYRRMFVFGAAASKYCLYDPTLQKDLENKWYCPPLGIEMFDERFDDLCRKFPGVLQTINEWQLNGKDIESLLETQWQGIKYKYDPIVHSRHINIQFFLQDLFIQISEIVNKLHHRSNLFDILVETLRRQNHKENSGTIYVSFNYDTILDHHLESIHRMKFNKMTDYINSNNSFYLLKPHGSSNWGFKYFDSVMPPEERKNIPDLLFKNKSPLAMIYYHLLGEYEDSLDQRSYGFDLGIHKKSKKSKYTINKDRMEVIPIKDCQDKYFPALLMPYREKDEFVMPYHHQSALNMFCTRQVEELYLIGWKGNEELFNKQFTDQDQLKRIIIVNPEPDVVKQNLSGYIDLDKIEVVEIPTFKSFVLEHLNACLNGND